MSDDKTPSRLDRLKQQQADLAAQIRREEKKLRERDEAAKAVRLLEIGKIADDLGITGLTDDAIRSALAVLAKK